MKGTLSGSTALFNRCVCAKLEKLSPAPSCRLSIPPSLSLPSLNVNAVRTEPRLTLLRNTAGKVIQVLPTVGR